MPRFLIAACSVCFAFAAASLAQAPMQCGQWLPLLGPGEQGLDGPVRSLAVFDDGDGPMLYAGGDFMTAGGQRSPYLARWDGKRWSPVPGLIGADLEMDAYIRCLTVWDDGTGAALYVGGAFSTAGGAQAEHIARFDGDSWSALAGPSGNGVDDTISAIQPHDAGDGEALYVGGRFATAGGVPANSVARWDGRTWSALEGDDLIDERIVDLQSFEGDLYASHWYDLALESGVQRWDGSTWSRVVGPTQSFITQEVWPLATWDDGMGERLYAGGRFYIEEGDTEVASGFAWWDGVRWNGPGRTRVASQLGDMLPFDDGTGEALYLAGSFENPADGRLSAAGRFIDGQTQALQGTPEIFGRALCVFDAGDGPALYVGGDFRPIPEYQPGYIARWQPRPRCVTDLTGDCLSDLRDFLEFQNLFGAGDGRADFDGDGSLTVFDFLAFQNAFNGGCP